MVNTGIQNRNFAILNGAKPNEPNQCVDHLLPEYEKLLDQIAETRNALKAQLMEALTR